MERIDFFIAGVQKSGTTALDAFLREHPNLQMADIKEVHFFDNEAVDWDEPDYALLHRHFDWRATNVLRGEATPIYTYWPNSLDRLKRYNPNARIIVGLRHPTMRAYSHWRMEVSRQAECQGFSEAIGAGRARVRDADGGVHRVFSYIERGYYHLQTMRLLGLFPRDQVHFFRTDRLFSETQETLDGIQRFLGVPSILGVSPRYIVPVVSNDLEQMADDDLRYLNAIFAPGIAITQRLTGLDLSDWLDADYAEPMSKD